MGLRIELLVVLVVCVNWFYVDARSLAISDFSVMQINAKGSKMEDTDSRNDKICTLCEQFTDQAIYYLGENKTQNEIIDALHRTCSRLHSLKKECITLVDYYAPLFFLEIAMVEPGSFCTKVNLCDELVLTSQKTCSLCHEAVAEVVNKLDDPEAQLDVIETLLKLCDLTEKYAKKCKKVVFAYGPLIMADAEKFLVKQDICTTIHACKVSIHEREAGISSAELSLLSGS